MPCISAVVTPVDATTFLPSKGRKVSRFATINAKAKAAGTLEPFVAPKNFAEFYDREPNYVKRWLRSSAARCPEDLREDFEQSLLLHLMTVGPKLAAQGFTDRIQTYNVTKMGGYGTRWAWAAYINTILLRKYGKLIDANRRGLTQGVNVVSLSVPGRLGPHAAITDHPRDLPIAIYVSNEVSKFQVEPTPVTSRILLERFAAYVEVQKGWDHRRVLRAMAACDSFSEVPAVTGLSADRCSTIRKNLRVLAHRFIQGRP